MNMYKQIKAAVTTRQAAEDYGLAVDRSGMALCPFHEDHHPSLKLDRRYYCFGCGESGDVIDFTARYYGISNQSAAIQLARDYGIDHRPLAELNIPAENAEPLPEEEQPCILSLSREVQRLRRWKWEFAPQNVGDLWDDRFVEACLNLDEKEYQLDLQLEPSAWRPSA
jgi:DNA primase